MKVQLTKTAHKDLMKIPQTKRTKLIKSLRQIDSPNIGKKLKGEFEGKCSLRVWPYRIIYEVYQNSIVIKSIKHRQGVYK